MSTLESYAEHMTDPVIEATVAASNRYPRPTRAQEAELALRAQQGDQEAVEALIMPHVPLVLREVVRPNAGKGVPVADLLQEAMAGMRVAVDRFEPERGIKFTSYAMWWARCHIQGAVNLAASDLRVHRLIAQSVRTAIGKCADAGEPITEENVRRRFNNRLGNWKTCGKAAFAATQRSIGLDAPVRGCERSIGYDFVAGSDGRDDQAELDAVVSADSLLADLTQQQRTVLERVFGLRGESETLREIGRDLGRSAERIRQIKEEAFQKIRIGMRAHARSVEFKRGRAA